MAKISNEAREKEGEEEKEEEDTKEVVGSGSKEIPEESGSDAYSEYQQQQKKSHGISKRQ